jgi:uncharacterized protein YjbI with pentapeptide repeats
MQRNNHFHSQLSGSNKRERDKHHDQMAASASKEFTKLLNTLADFFARYPLLAPGSDIYASPSESEHYLIAEDEKNVTFMAFEEKNEEKQEAFNMGDLSLFPTEILTHIASYLSVHELSLLLLVSKGWQPIAIDALTPAHVLSEIANLRLDPHQARKYIQSLQRQQILEKPGFQPLKVCFSALTTNDPDSIDEQALLFSLAAIRNMTTIEGLDNFYDSVQLTLQIKKMIANYGHDWNKENHLDAWLQTNIVHSHIISNVASFLLSAAFARFEEPSLASKYASSLDEKCNALTHNDKPLIINFMIPNLNLAHTNLIGADLRGVNLQQVNLSCSFMTAINLQEANLQGANLYFSGLERANLSKANLSNANLSSTRLFGTNLQDANLDGATFEGAILIQTQYFSRHAPDTLLSRLDSLCRIRVASNPSYETILQTSVAEDLIQSLDGDNLSTHSLSITDQIEYLNQAIEHPFFKKRQLSSLHPFFRQAEVISEAQKLLISTRDSLLSNPLVQDKKRYV